MFYTGADNLVVGDSNSYSDVFVHDRVTRITERVNVSSDGSQAVGGSSWARNISADGRFVTFTSDSRNLIADDTNWVRDLFIHDRELGTTERVNLTNDGQQELSNGPGVSSMSDDGRYLVLALNQILPVSQACLLVAICIYAIVILAQLNWWMYQAMVNPLIIPQVVRKNL